MIRPLIFIAALAVAPSFATAQTTVHYREGQAVNPSDVARILSAASLPKTRSIRLLDADTSPHGHEPVPASLSLPVRFAFDSAEILPSARPQVDALAVGIKLLPVGQAVYIEGHSDAVGTDEYNVLLSFRRAQAVKQYLVRVHGIDAYRLKESGLGKARPIEGLDPYAPENRRVQFRGN